MRFSRKLNMFKNMNEIEWHYLVYKVGSNEQD